jgi:succinoglycan biosynthesis transport protein ExoP
MLEKELKATKAEFDSLNARSFEYQALKREAEADKKLYEELVRKIKEATINASFQNSGAGSPIRHCRPQTAAGVSQRKLNVLLAFLFSSLLAAGRRGDGDVLDDTVRDPEQVERT